MPIEKHRSAAEIEPAAPKDAANVRRIRYSFVIVALLFTALALTAVLIWVR
jgi:hypothetical protein